MLPEALEGREQQPISQAGSKSNGSGESATVQRAAATAGGAYSAGGWGQRSDRSETEALSSFGKISNSETEAY